MIAASDTSGAQSLSDTIEPAVGDNDSARNGTSPVGAEFRCQTFSTTWRFNHFSALDLGAAPTRVTGKTATVTVTARNSDGKPDPGRAVRYAIVGANPGSGAVTTGADGTAAITWTGTTRDRHAHRLHRLNSNGVRDANEPERGDGDVDGTAAPGATGTGQVGRREGGLGHGLHQAPGSGRARATGPPKGFVPFTGAANIPVGSQLDTSKGRVELTSAADTGAPRPRPRTSMRDLPGQAERAQEEAQEGQGADHRSGDEGSDRAVAVRAVEGRRAAGASAKKKKRARRRCWASCGAAARAGSAPRASTARRRCAARSGWWRIAATAR